MNDRYYGWVEMAFTGFIVLGLAFWQLWSLMREQKRDRQAAERKAADPDA